MKTIRRLYFYTVALVSLETTLWGTIGLARSLFAADEIGSNVSRLAGALSLVLVGIPIFLLHWWLAQRSAASSAEERYSRVRAIFLYGALGGTLVPAVQNILAFIDRSLLQLLGRAPAEAIFGGGQTWVDNLTAIVLNLVIAAYFFRVLRLDWQNGPVGAALAETRRLYRYLWMVYGLAMIVFGSQQLILYLLTFPVVVTKGILATLAHGIGLLLVGTPIWVVFWQRIQRALAEGDAAQSLVRLIVLYGLSFIGIGTLLTAGGMVLYTVLRVAFGEALSGTAFMGEISEPLAAAIPFGLVWAYFGRVLGKKLRVAPPSAKQPVDESAPRWAALRRLYYYVLALIGLGAAFTGVYLLLGFLLDFLLGEAVVWGAAMRDNLASSLATLAVGMPLWVTAWRPMLREATGAGESGDHARRSLIRKGYLYLILFVGVIGVMFSSGALVFQLLSTWLGEPPDNLLLTALQLVKFILLFALLLAYHWWALQTDNRLAARWLAQRHAQFPVLVLDPSDGVFAEQVVLELEKEVDALPVAVHPLSKGVPGEDLASAKLVVIPAQLVAQPTESFRLWLQNFNGTRLMVPSQVSGWHWVFGSGRTMTALAHRTADIVRHLAEGEELPKPREASTWSTLMYILGGLFIAELVFFLISMGVSLLF